MVSFLHCFNWILPKWHIWYEELLGQNHFWHVPQTCPDLPSATVRPVSFFGVDFLMGTCASCNQIKLQLLTLLILRLMRKHNITSPLLFVLFIRPWVACCFLLRISNAAHDGREQFGGKCTSGIVACKVPLISASLPFTSSSCSLPRIIMCCRFLPVSILIG